jgi:hypothetical protein
MATTTNTTTPRLLLAVRGVSRKVLELRVRTNVDQSDRQPSQLDRLLSDADRPASVVYHSALVRRI